MSGTDEPGLAKSLITIHKVVTRGIEVTKGHSKSFADEGLSDASLRSGFVSYVRVFVSITHAHHLTEDEVIFPYFRERIREAPFDLLIAQHRAIAALLDEVEAAISRIQQFPEAWGRISERYRHCQLRRFPYSIVYAEGGDDEIVVISIFHQSREPMSWQRNL